MIDKKESQNKERIGVFVCHCGHNIAATVNIEKVGNSIRKYDGVTHCEDYKYMCSEPGQNLIKEKIKSHKLNRVVVACCSPSLHEKTFRNTVQGIGLNPYLLEIANIREQCSWVHTDVDKATKKAIKLIKSIIEKTRANDILTPIKIPVTPKVLVIGAGIAGIQTSLDIANSGYKVILLEKSPSIGGHMAQLSETFPTLDCSQCILTPKMVEIAQNENINLLTNSEIIDISGNVGNFKVKINKKARYINETACTGCGECIEKCPVTVDSEFDEGLGKRKAIYTPFPQAVPNIPVIDKASCLYFLKDGKCGLCQKICTTNAIDYDQKDEINEENVGAIVLATGYELYPKDEFPEYGGEKYKDVINGLQFERLLSASGPTQGEIRRPSDGKIPKKVAFISCVGSRDPEKHLSYCSKVCCMYMSKHAKLYKEKVPDGEAIIFYIDVRTSGKDYEEFYTRAKDEENILYIRGKPSRIIKQNNELVIWSINTLTGRQIRVTCDMIVLSMAIVPSKDIFELASKLKIQTDENGFLKEVHPKLRPVESLVPGFFLAGCCHSPKDIPDSVAQASASASKVLEMFSAKEVSHEPLIATIDDDFCSTCKICVSVCPYNAIEFDEQKKEINVSEALCMGCGSCVSACPSGALQQNNMTGKQIAKMVEVILD